MLPLMSVKRGFCTVFLRDCAVKTGESKDTEKSKTVK